MQPSPWLRGYSIHRRRLHLRVAATLLKIQKMARSKKVLRQARPATVDRVCRSDVYGSGTCYCNDTCNDVVTTSGAEKSRVLAEA